MPTGNRTGNRHKKRSRPANAGHGSSSQHRRTEPRRKSRSKPPPPGTMYNLCNVRCVVM